MSKYAQIFTPKLYAPVSINEMCLPLLSAQIFVDVNDDLM